MKKSHIIIPHKCGSTIICKITREICQEHKVQFEDLDHSVTFAQKKPELHISFTRKVCNSPLSEFKWDEKNTDKYLFVIRHPISRLISAYYSFGWTHATQAAWIKDAEKRKLTEKKMSKLRNRIQNLTLEEYIEGALCRNSKELEHQSSSRILEFIRQCTTLPNPDNTLILPYELFIARPINFFNQAFRFLDLPRGGQYVANKYKSEITPVNDSTEKIKKQGFKTHRRSSDIHEWKSKINIEDLLSKTTEENRLLIESYSKFLQQYNVI